MKKLLVATSALVAAGSAAALEVTLGGEVEAVVKYEKDAWSQSAPATTLSLDIAGESMGWSYGGSFDVKTEVDAVAADAAAGVKAVSRVLGGPGGAELFIGSDALGKVTLAGSCGNFVDMDDNSIEGSDVASITGGCIEFTGASAAGWFLSTALDVDNMAATVVGVSGSVAGASLAAEVVTGTGRFDATVSTAIGGATVALEMTGDIDAETDAVTGNNDHKVDYEASLDFSAMGLDFGTAIRENGDLQVSTTIGNVTLKMNNYDDAAGNGTEFLDNWSAEYKSTLAEGLTVKAKIDSNDTLTVTSTLEF